MSEVRSAADEMLHLEEGSWAYLGLGEELPQAGAGLRQGVVEACRANGWPAVSWSPQPRQGHGVARFFEGMDHAVEHADVVIVRLDSASSVVDAELTLAYRHKRPVIGLSLAGERPQSSAVRRMLRSYERARVVEGSDIDSCVAGLLEALGDRGFVATIHEAAGEAADHV